MPPWVIIGAGYTGGALARRLVADGHEVIATRRTAGTIMLGPPGDVERGQLERPAPASARSSLPAIALDLTARSEQRFPGSIIVCCAPPGADPAGEIGNLVALGGRRIVYVSSTGVYAPGGGAWVDERWPLEPVTASGRARLTAERALPADAAILRAAGIYGPGRGLVERLRAGTYRIVGDGRAHVSRIHVADLVETIVRAGTRAATGAFNVADDDPAPIGDVADAVAAHLGLPPPPRVAASSVGAEIAGMLTADRRIANTRIKRELGVVLTYPSWRASLTPGIA